MALLVIGYCSSTTDCSSGEPLLSGTEKCLALGAEQGGVPSGGLYIIHNNEHLDTAQESNLGLHIHGLQVAAIGQSDDCVLVSDDLLSLKYLLELT